MNRTVPSDAPKSRGKAALAKHLSGAKLTLRQAALAKCCECMGYWRDGRVDCRMPMCPLYPWMPYRERPGKAGNGSIRAVPGDEGGPTGGCSTTR